ncbi:hypothetical protein PHET_08515 [Paragonimus heterotremus]|uniref:Uncharacterized protein n=1 Tax=Paragonimus heterotremus TaxID=100268 RepID=A0A8J4WVI1_9TREM|nr:hypothetical protein PHET_08515 [Paragonimus heterotremus]
MFLLVRIDFENRMVVIHSSWMMRNNWALIPPYWSMEELRSLVDQNKPLPNDTPAYQVTVVHLTDNLLHHFFVHFFAASLEEVWSHMRTVDLDESMRIVPMVSRSSPRKVLGTILNHTSSTSSKEVNVHLLLLKVDMLEKLMRSKSGVGLSPKDDIKSLACLPFMAPYRTLTDFDTGEVILTSEEKKKTAVPSTYASLIHHLRFSQMRFLSRHPGTTLGSLLRQVCLRLFTDDFHKIVGWTDKRNQGRQIKGSKILLTIQSKAHVVRKPVL